MRKFIIYAALGLVSMFLCIDITLIGLYATGHQDLARQLSIRLMSFLS